MHTMRAHKSNNYKLVVGKVLSINSGKKKKKKQTNEEQ